MPHQYNSIAQILIFGNHIRQNRKSDFNLLKDFVKLNACAADKRGLIAVVALRGADDITHWNRRNYRQNGAISGG
jgi:hypothetical protein